MPVQVEMEVITGRKRNARKVSLDDGDEVRIGTDPGSDVRYESPYVAPLHAVLRLEAGRLVVLNRSINGTSVNGSPAERALLRDGDVVAFGEGAALQIGKVGAAEATLAAPVAKPDKEASTLSRLTKNPLVLAGAGLYALLATGFAFVYLGAAAPTDQTGGSRAAWEATLEQTKQFLIESELPPTPAGVLPLELTAALAGPIAEPARLYATLVETRAGRLPSGNANENARLLADKIAGELDRLMLAAWKAEATGRLEEAVWVYRDMLDIVPAPSSPSFRVVQSRLAVLPQPPIAR
jgi:hypothetical protein